MANSAHAAARARRQFTVLTGPKNFISDLGEMTVLAGQVIKMAVRGPYDYWGEAREIMFQALSKSGPDAKKLRDAIENVEGFKGVTAAPAKPFGAERHHSLEGKDMFAAAWKGGVLAKAQ